MDKRCNNKQHLSTLKHRFLQPTNGNNYYPATLISLHQKHTFHHCFIIPRHVHSKVHNINIYYLPSSTSEKAAHRREVVDGLRQSDQHLLGEDMLNTTANNYSNHWLSIYHHGNDKRANTPPYLTPHKVRPLQTSADLSNFQTHNLLLIYDEK